MCLAHLHLTNIPIKNLRMQNLFTNLPILNVRGLSFSGLLLWMVLLCCLPSVTYAQPACTFIVGSYTQNGTLDIELAGITPCTQHDQVQVTTGSATFTSSATINVSNYLAYLSPANCTSYTILTATGGVTLAGGVTVIYPAGYNREY